MLNSSFSWFSTIINWWNDCARIKNLLAVGFVLFLNKSPVIIVESRTTHTMRYERIEINFKFETFYVRYIAVLHLKKMQNSNGYSTCAATPDRRESSLQIFRQISASKGNSTTYEFNFGYHFTQSVALPTLRSFFNIANHSKASNKTQLAKKLQGHVNK